MSVFIRWVAFGRLLPADPVESVTRALHASAVSALAGSSWYRLGRTEAEAMVHRVSIAPDSTAGRTVRMPDGRAVWKLATWNGSHDRPVNLSVSVDPRADKLSYIVISVPGQISAVAQSKISWDLLLDVGRGLAASLPGVCYVSSDELVAQVGQRVAPPLMPAYAYFWGRSSEDIRRRYPQLVSSDGETVFAHSWDDVLDSQFAKIF